MARNAAIRSFAAALLLTFAGAASARAAEHITLRNGFQIDCVRRAPEGNKVRLFLTSDGTDNYMDVAADAIVRVEDLPNAPTPPKALAAPQPAPVDVPALLDHAGAEHHIDAELLASVVHAESGGNTHAISRTGARGLMQLMPGTAAAVGVQDAFAPDQNIEGGSAYLDSMLTRYHDNIALALAAYNAGPAAVDHYHGVPPYRETRAYVSRVIREFNRRKALLLAENQPPAR